VKIAFEDVRVPTFSGFAMAMWITPFLIAGSIAAMFGAPETHSPLVLTLLLTSIATAAVSIFTSSLDGGRTTAMSAENRSVSTFIFVNSAGTMVGLVTNFSESIERWQPAGPNGLTFIYASVFREVMPLSIYALLLILMIGAALYFVLRGSSLLSAREQPSEEELASLGSWSGSLLALWIFTCMRWQPLSWGAETVAATWTVLVYAAMLIVGAWLYGLFGLRVVRWLARAAFELASAATEVLSDPKTWRTVLLTILVAGVVVTLIAAAFLLAGWVAAGIVVMSDQVGPAQIREALRSYAAAISLTLSLLAKGALGLTSLLVLLWMPSLLNVLWAGVKTAALTGRRSIGSMKFKLPTVRGRLGWFVIAFLWGARATFRAVIARQRAISRLLAVAVPSIILVAASTNGLPTVYISPVGRVIHASPPVLPVEPAASLVPAVINTVSFESTELCDVDAGEAEWAYEDDARVSVSLTGCRISASIGRDEALLVIAMATNGISQLDEEHRAKRRLDNLMTWARRELGPSTPIYGLSLGMATGPNSYIELSRTFGASWSERPLIGLIVRSNLEIGDDAMQRSIVELLRHNPLLAHSYTECSIWAEAPPVNRALDCFAEG